MKKILIAGILGLFAQHAMASGDTKPLYSGQTSNFLVDVLYGREWEFASGDRNDGPMIVVTPQGSQIGPSGNQAGSLYFIGNSDLVKMYEATLLGAQASGKAVIFRYGSKWGRYKNPLDDADNPVNGWATGYKILGVSIAP